jgi:acetylornithine/succinyldiaminopimelate/putrescine aminotransferase
VKPARAAGECGGMPDMGTLAKGSANGVPMGAALMTPAVAARVKLDDLGTTFGGGPLACAALLAVLDSIAAAGLVEHARALGTRMQTALRAGPVEEVRGRGCLIGLRVRGEARPVQRALLDRGFITGTSADPRVLRLLPPINLPFEAVDALAAALATLGEPTDATLA